MTESTARKAVFLDRDGTLIEDLRFFPFTDEAVSLLKSHGYLLIVVTNQSGIARGIFEEEAMHAIHEKIQEDLTHGIDAFLFCPHMPDHGCECRKPGVGMIESARQIFEIDMENSWLVGDKVLDVMTGVNAGIRTALVRTGYGTRATAQLNGEPDLIVDNLLEAALRITRS